LDPGILDKKLDLQDQGVVDHMIEVLNIALLCSNLSPYERPPMRHVVVMLSESKDRTRASSASSPASDHPSKKDNS
jgi:hypothetical protein